MRNCALLTVLTLFFVSGCGGGKPKFTEEELAAIPLAPREGLPEPSGGFVLAVGGETVTSDEIITAPLLEYFKPIAEKNFEQFKKQARPELERIISAKISNILLYQQARRDSGMGVDLEDALEKATESEVRRFIAGFDGDYAKAEQALKQIGMDWDEFREYQRKMILSQDYIRRQMPENRPVTYNELVSCYNEMKEEHFATPATMTFRLIDIQVSKMQATEPNISPPEQAREFADKLMERLRKGEDFGRLARQYSHGHKASFGGLWKPVNPAALAEPYDVLAAEAEKMKPSQIAGPVESGGHIFIMKLEEKKPKSFVPLEDVQKEIEAKIIFDRRKEAVDELGIRLVQQAALNKMDEFTDFCLKKIYRTCNQ